MSTYPYGMDEAELKRQLDQAFGEVSPEDLERMARDGPREPRADERGRIRGRVLSIRGSDVFVDIGGRSEGFIPLDEFEPDQPPAVGDVLDLIPHGFDKNSGLMRLSLRETKLAADMDTIRIGDVVKARVTGSNIGGLELRVHGARGFMPLSQVDIVRHDDLSSFMGRWLECEVTEVDRKGRNLVLSRRRLLEQQREEERRQLRYQLAEKQVRRGRVSRLADFGAFIDLGGMEALLHISDMSWGRIGHPSEVLKEGDEVEVQVLKIDLVKDRISLGLKQLTPDPWTLVSANYVAGQTVEGRVTKVMNFGAFVELEPGVEGLIPISELSWTQHVRHPKEILKEGDRVRVAVLSVDAEKRKIAMSLRALSADPWEGVEQRYEPDMLVSGAVTRITKFGAFVRLEEGVEGLVHISQLSHKRVKSVGDVLQVGQVVQLRVLSVDVAQRRISLSVKAAASQPAEEAPPAAERSAAAGSEGPKPGKEEDSEKRKRKRPLRGGLTW